TASLLLAFLAFGLSYLVLTPSVCSPSCANVGEVDNGVSTPVHRPPLTTDASCGNCSSLVALAGGRPSTRVTVGTGEPVLMACRLPIGDLVPDRRAARRRPFGVRGECLPRPRKSRDWAAGSRRTPPRRDCVCRGRLRDPYVSSRRIPGGDSHRDGGDATRAFLGGRGGTKGRPELEVRDKKGPAVGRRARAVD
ncbi:hypothetical protein THAOC_06861, partial [Thalassiosira oceanica]